MLTLGFDTSNYTTSVAAFDGVGGKNCSRLLDVKPGAVSYTHLTLPTKA